MKNSKSCFRHQRTLQLQFCQTGIALVIVLWMLTLLSVIAITFSGMTRTENQLTRNFVHLTQARAEAESGFWYAVYDLLKPVNDRRFYPDGSANTISTENGLKQTIKIQDESGKIDLNKASRELLLGLYQSNGVDYDESTHLVDVTLDWRDKDNLRRTNGAEDSDYTTAGLPYGAKDGLFNSIEELQQILGMTPFLFKKLRPTITVHSMQSRIRLNAAPISVLRVLPGMTDELIEQIIAGRSNGETAIISSILPEAVRPLVFTSGHGNVYTVTSEADIDGVTSRLQVTLILKKSGNRPITIIDWQENALPLTTQQEYLPENIPENETEL